MPAFASQGAEPPVPEGEPPKRWHDSFSLGDPLNEDWNPDLAVPCSRYGRTGGDAAWYALGGLIAYDASAGLDNQVDGIMMLDELMSYVVNEGRK